MNRDGQLKYIFNWLHGHLSQLTLLMYYYYYYYYYYYCAALEQRDPRPSDRVEGDCAVHGVLAWVGLGSGLG